MSTYNRFATLNAKFQKGDKGDMANVKMYTFLEQNARTLFDQSEHGYGVRQRVYVRCLTNQSAAIAYVTGCMYAV